MSTAGKTLSADSVGAIINPAWSDSLGAMPATERRRDEARRPAPGGIGQEVLSVQRPSRPWLAGLVGIVVAGGLHAGAAGAMRDGSAPQPDPTRRPMVVVEHEIDLEPPPEPEPKAPTPPPQETPPEPPARLLAKTSQAETAPAEAEQKGPPPPAQAGEVVAIDAPAEPLDFTGFDITTGEGKTYAGGVTASSGTNTDAVHAPAIDPNAPADGPRGQASRARPVSLPARNWSCPWPREAEALGIDEQIVVLRAIVAADGRTSSVDLLADPGHGFGEAALSCARSARFEPARDRAGQAYAATSPPIRVRFTR